MLKQFIISLLLLTSLMPSIQAEPAEQAHVDLEDKCLAAVAGFCGAYATMLVADTAGQYIIHNKDMSLLLRLGALTLYGFLFGQKR